MTAWSLFSNCAKSEASAVEPFAAEPDGELTVGGAGESAGCWTGRITEVVTGFLGQYSSPVRAVNPPAS